MCAINGITNKDITLVRRMNEVTLHRGPDGSSVYADEYVTLGHNRLAVIDTTDASLQPMHSKDMRYTIVYNGEIYNFRELRNELSASYSFTTQGDTEVLLASYIVWGSSMFSKLNGVFAFAIWDNKNKELLLARDHMGVKPLYYIHEDGTFKFSSEIPALLLNRKSNKIDDISLSFFIAMGYVPSPRTIVKGVFKLPPGHMLIYKYGAFTVKKFFKESIYKKEATNEEIYNALDLAVSRQLVSDRQVGAYLSGGFDSNIIVHHMRRHIDNVRTYSVKYEAVYGQESDSEKFNHDALLAEKTALAYGITHKTVDITLTDLRKNIEPILKKMSEPVANPTAIAQYFLNKFVRSDGTVVVLGGDGGDELFGGYTRHRALMACYLYQYLPVWMQTAGEYIFPRAQKLRTPLGSHFHSMIMAQDEKKIFPFLQANVDININKNIGNFFNEFYNQDFLPKEHPLDTFMYIDRKTWLPDENFIRSDYMSMAHGVELRVPFVDVDVVHCADQISAWRKTFPHKGKMVIRSTYHDYLPSYINKQPKRGWISPSAKWFRDPEISLVVKEIFSSTYYQGLNSIIDWSKTQNLLESHIDKRAYYAQILWSLLVLQIWAREHDLVM